MEINQKDKKGIEKFSNKQVSISFLNDENELHTTVGILTEYREDDYDNETDKLIEGYVIVESDTDYDRIPLNKIRKIYLKE